MCSPTYSTDRTTEFPFLPQSYISATHSCLAPEFIPQNALTSNLALGQAMCEIVGIVLHSYTWPREARASFLVIGCGSASLETRATGRNVRHLLATGRKTLLFSCYVKFSSHTDISRSCLTLSTWKATFVTLHKLWAVREAT